MFVIVLNFIKFHTWKVIFIWITHAQKKTCVTAWTKFGNWIKKVCKKYDFWGKESHIWRLVLWSVCGVFVENSTREPEKDLQLIWPLKCDTACHQTFICFKLLLSLDYMVFHLFPHWPNTTMSMKSTTIDLLSEIARLTVLFWSSVQIYTHNESLPCVIHVKITFHVWNLIRFLKLKIIYNYSKGTRV